MAIEDMNTTGMETSADMIMPLPLTEEQIENLTDENYTMEVTIFITGRCSHRCNEKRQ